MQTDGAESGSAQSAPIAPKKKAPAAKEYPPANPAAWAQIGGFPGADAIDAFIQQTRALVTISEQCERDATRVQQRTADRLADANKFQTDSQQRVGARNKKLLENSRRVEAIKSDKNRKR